MLKMDSNVALLWADREWRVHTNVHPNTDGTPWGWVEAVGSVGSVAYWSGQAGCQAASNMARKHNDTLKEPHA